MPLESTSMAKESFGAGSVLKAEISPRHFRYVEK
jgi:hypothetical protein